MNGLKRRLDEAKGSRANELPLVLWSYHTTPQSSTGIDALIPIEILEPSPRRMLTEKVPNQNALTANLDLMDEVKDLAKVKEEAAKQRQRKGLTPRSDKEAFGSAI